MAANTQPTREAPCEQVVDDDALYEIVDGKRVAKSSAGALQVNLANILSHYLNVSGFTFRLGRTAIEMLFELPKVARCRRPDLAFVSYERWPRQQPVPDTEAWAVVPNLAVEIISRTNTAEDVNEKVGDYFKAGVQQVWLIWPRTRQAHVYVSAQTIHVIEPHEELVGDPVLPGFRLPLAKLFETPEAKGTPGNGTHA